MQTGTSGCQYSWLTICLLLLFVFCYQHTQQQNLSFNHSSLYATTREQPVASQHLNAPILMMAKIMDAQIHVGKIQNNKNTNTNMLENILILTELSDKEQYHTLTIIEQILYVEQRLKHGRQKEELLPPMLMLMLMLMTMNVKDCNETDADDNNCFVIVSGSEVSEHLLLTRNATIQQQKCVQTLTSNSTLFGSVTAALVHLTTWPTALLLLFLSYIKNNTKASTFTTQTKLVLVHAQNVKSKVT